MQLSHNEENIGEEVARILPGPGFTEELDAPPQLPHLDLQRSLVGFRKVTHGTVPFNP